jgi:hypothetical protein
MMMRLSRLAGRDMSSHRLPLTLFAQISVRDCPLSHGAPFARLIVEGWEHCDPRSSFSSIVKMRATRPIRAQKLAIKPLLRDQAQGSCASRLIMSRSLVTRRRASSSIRRVSSVGMDW